MKYFFILFLLYWHLRLYGHLLEWSTCYCPLENFDLHPISIFLTIINSLLSRGPLLVGKVISFTKQFKYIFLGTETTSQKYHNYCHRGRRDLKILLQCFYVRSLILCRNFLGHFNCFYQEIFLFNLYWFSICSIFERHFIHLECNSFRGSFLSTRFMKSFLIDLP